MAAERPPPRPRTRRFRPIALTEREARALELRAAGLGYQEIAERLGGTVGAIGALLVRARLKAESIQDLAAAEAE